MSSKTKQASSRRTKATPLRRRDAQENRARVIAAAREVFATSGFDAPLSAIASHAGVGRATLYRNFPDRFVLATAIFEENLAELEALASEHGGQVDAFMTLLSAMVEQQIEAHAIFPALLGEPSMPNLDQLVARTKTLLEAPLRAALGEGAVRSDLTLADVIAVLGMISAAVMGVSSVSTRRKRAMRALELLTNGMAPRA